ncbi:MAG TPA: protein translocase subunit SecD [Dehalococcoidia bacterium]|nr:protein translocase subunit SecD [Dehalococcoidia bacterium]
MTRRNTLVFIIILALFAFAICALVYPMFGREEMKLGLDLVGGVHLVYQADFPEDASGEEKARAMDRALVTIEKRIDKYGVTEPIIQQLGEDRILVQLPGFTDIEAAKSLVEQTGFLEFREVEMNNSGQPVYLDDYLNQEELQFIDEQESSERVFVTEVLSIEGEIENKTVAFLLKDNSEVRLTDASGEPADNTTLQGYADALSWIPARGDDGTQITGDLLADAFLSLDQSGVAATPQVSIEWNDEGGIIFDEIAERLYNSGEYGSSQRALGIFLDNTLLSAPQILEPEYRGSGVITGDFTLEEAAELANLLKSGALPMPLKKPPLYQEKVSATLGADFIDMSLKAGLIGIILVMLFMIVYYRLPGLLASLALIFYGAVVLALFKLWPGGGVTLTLAGIGGFVLSIGMAVDANVLIFERMKDELREGRTLGAAIEVGFNRAWTAIRDSNVTTFIVCGILYWLGSSIVASTPVMGFALTLLIGVAVSMFTAIVVTRTLLRLFVGTRLAQRTSLFNVYAGKG